MGEFCESLGGECDATDANDCHCRQEQGTCPAAGRTLDLYFVELEPGNISAAWDDLLRRFTESLRKPDATVPLPQLQIAQPIPGQPCDTPQWLFTGNPTYYVGLDGFRHSITPETADELDRILYEIQQLTVYVPNNWWRCLP